MRAKRAKLYRKLMKQYAFSFNFREPYQILLDADLILTASRTKLNLGNLLSATLSGTIKPMITQCCIRHLYSLDPTTHPEKETCISVAKEAERRRCGHHELEEPLSALECLKSVVDPKGSGTNRHRYVVASQSEEVRRFMRGVVGVPLVRFNGRGVLVLEPMSEVSGAEREREERGKVRAGLKAARGVKRNRDEDGGSDEGAQRESGEVKDGAKDIQVAKKTKVKGVKGPNPLSVKKTKKPVARQIEDERAVVRKAAEQDPQATEKALDGEVALDATPVNGVDDGSRKRKRKRKTNESVSGAAIVAVAHTD